MKRALSEARLALLLAATAVAGCAEQEESYFQGYVEGEYVYVSSALAGELEELAVAKGQVVEQGALLFRLDPNPQALQVDELRERREQARAKLADMEKGGRPSELAAIEARLDSARAGLEGAERDYERRREILAAGHADAVSAEELDRFHTDRDVRRSEVATLEAELETARLGGRADAVLAAGKDVAALEAALREVEWQVEQKRVSAPAAGIVQDTLFHVGEQVPSGRPVIALLPPENVKVRFFVPQALLPTLHVGDAVRVQLDGLELQVQARISFISTEAEFTPPVIYSKESRTKLVFMIEATPDTEAAEGLHPGQPLEVRLD